MQSKVTVATVYGRPYYKITTALKLMDIQFDSLSPQEAAVSNAKVIITTEDEAEIVRRKDVLLDTELDNCPAVLKAKILKTLMGDYHDDELTIGIDPGERIGISVIYLHNEIDSILESSITSTIRVISSLLLGIVSKKKIIRIGDGNIGMAQSLAKLVRLKFMDRVEIEIVNEHGTSLPRNIEANRRGIRDKSSARVIALRKGRSYK
ncbi:MAG TPA: hypothetical protein VJ729_05725 [Nitrososphaeraceae archaeon]|nr:hypothetical protein [Nitrososphaeraceae archaeon]